MAESYNTEELLMGTCKKPDQKTPHAVKIKKKKRAFLGFFADFHFSLNHFLGVVHQRVVEPFFLEVFSVFP